MKELLWVLIGATILVVSHPVNAETLSTDGQATAAFLNKVENNPNELMIFLENMPKGGDLHNHRSGSAYAENMIAAAMNDPQHNYCVDPKTSVISLQANCPTQLQIKNLATNSPLYNQIINAWSMRNFIASPTESAHDHFFATFMKYLDVSSTQRSANLTEIVNRAGKENELYLETMITSGDSAAMALGAKFPWNNDFASYKKLLDEHGINNIVDDVIQQLNTNEAYMNKTLMCHTPNAQPGCNVTVRYQYIALRSTPPALMFAQLVTGFEVANKDPRVVAINIVAPEDDYYALRDYHLHMQMINYLHQLYPNVHIDLHAGELTLGLVSPDNLTFHIRDAIDTAKAERIGHGVDISYEDQSFQLLQQMATQRIPVEICLTSNATILGIKPDKHPIKVYLKAGVPVVLATDDEGVLRTDLTNEYRLAISNYHLDYSTVKMIARNSLTYNFMPGNSLWLDPKQFTLVNVCSREGIGNAKPSAPCADFLAKNPKAALQWQLEHQFVQFETQMAATYRAQTAVE